MPEVESAQRKNSGPAPRPSRWWLIAPWIMGLLALAALVAVVVHVGEIKQFVALAESARPEWLLLALLAQTATYVCAAGVWQRTLIRAGHPQKLKSLIPLGLAKLFTDQVVPSGGISGTMLVMRALVRRHVPMETALGVFLVGFVSFYMAYMITVLISLIILWLHHRAGPALLTVAAIFSAVAVLTPVGVLWLRSRAPRRVPAWLDRIPGLSALRRAAAEAPTGLLRNPRLLAEAVALQLAVFLLDSLTLWLVFMALGTVADFPAIFVSFIMASVVATISPLPLGLGSFEAGSVAMLSLLGIPVEIALTATLLLRGLTFWLPMLPGPWLARREIGRSKK